VPAPAGARQNLSIEAVACDSACELQGVTSHHPIVLRGKRRSNGAGAGKPSWILPRISVCRNRVWKPYIQFRVSQPQRRHARATAGRTASSWGSVCGARRSAQIDANDRRFARLGSGLNARIVLRRAFLTSVKDNHKEPLPVFDLCSRAWLEGAAIESGPVFRSVTRHGKLGARMSDYAVALVVKKYAGSVGLEPRGYSGHSLRPGLATSAAIAGASERAIMNQTGHRGAAMVRRYIREESVPGECGGEGRAVTFLAFGITSWRTDT
jgi:Phage integrase family